MMSGKSTVINMTTISTNRNGTFCFTIFSSDCFDMPWPRWGEQWREEHDVGRGVEEHAAHVGVFYSVIVGAFLNIS